MSQSSLPEKANRSVITDWRPEDPEFWQQRGHRVASRNLWISVPCLLLAFCVWMLFSAVAVNLNKVGFQFTTDQLFMLTALPALSGALLRVPYAFMVPLFGGRRWTVFSTGIMIVPCVWLGFAQGGNFIAFFAVFMVLFLTAGLGSASTFQMISVIFRKLTMDRVKAQGGSEAQAMREAATDTAAALGFISAIGAIGGFFIPKAFGISLDLTGSPAGAMKVFLVFYIACVVITWAVYGRKRQ